MTRGHSLARRASASSTATAAPSPRAEASHLAEAVRDLYAPGWAVFTEVRNTTGAGHDVLRYADVVAVDLWPSSPDAWRIHGFEVKRTRKDWCSELRDPAKSAPIKLFCASWYVVVPAPWTNVILTLAEIPDRWGLLEVGTGGAEIVLQAGERQAEPPTPGFVRSLFRAASAGAVSASPPGDAPVVLVTRPYLSKKRVGLACGHAVTCLANVRPERLPCEACLAGAPTDVEMIEAAIGEATLDQLDRYAALLAARRAA